MIKTKFIHHVAIVVKDLEKSKWFYGELFGLDSIPRPPFNFPGEWYQCDAQQSHLVQMDEEMPKTSRHVGFEVDYLKSCHEELVKNEVEIVSPPGTRQDGSLYMFCHDPDGNLVEITQH